MDRSNAVNLRYRHDLRGRNELNHTHLDAQIEQRLAGVRAEFCTELQHLRTEMQQVRTQLYQTRLELPGLVVGFWIAAVIGATALAIALR